MLLLLTVAEPGREAGTLRRAAIERQLLDGLLVLEDFPLNDTVHGNRTLAKYVNEAFWGNGTNLSEAIEPILPEGALFNVYLSNGHAGKALLFAREPGGETVSVSRPFRPQWSYTLLLTDFTHYPDDRSLDMNVSAVTVYRSNPVDATGLTVEFANGFRAGLDGLSPRSMAYNASIPAEAGANSYQGYGANATGWKDPGTDRAHESDRLQDRYGQAKMGRNLTYEVSYPGPFNYRVSASNFTDADKAAVKQRETGFVTQDRVAVGGRVNLRWDMSALTATRGTGFATGTVQSVTATVLGPVLGHPYELPDAGTGVVASRFTSTGATGEANLTIPRNATLGVYAVEFAAHVVSPGSVTRHTEAVRRMDPFVVTLPDGTLPLDPVYTLDIVAWLPDWG